ncbi:MAG: lytic transglycosylase domain-containing protein [Prevotellaceae bacterium]|nr:lytic transglycosylase domain-containing protein [Prevotellaceae bacterium]
MRNLFRFIMLSATCLFLVSFNDFPAQPVHSFPIPEQAVFAGDTMPLVRNDLRERFDRELSHIAYNHGFTLLGLKRANRYFPIIEPILTRNGIPADFKYLALIESNLSNKVVSSTKAAGFWQFMPETAKEYGLEVNEQVDERYHIEKSTEAACEYFRRAYAKYGDWLVVAASYNAGMGRLSTELQKQQEDCFHNLWLNEETSRYVFRLLAMKTFLAEPQCYGYRLAKSELYATVRCVELTVDSTVTDWAVFAKEHDIPYVLFKEYNTWVRARKLDNKACKEYKIILPRKEDLEFDPRKIKVYQANWVMDN